MSEIKKTYDEFLSGKINAFELQENFFWIYAKSDKSEKTKNEILSIIEETLTKNVARSDLWLCFFESDKKMHDEIVVLSCLVDARKSLADNLVEKSNVLLEVTAGLAYSQIKKYDGLMMERVEGVWLNVFRGLPEFGIALDKEKLFWEEHDKKLKQEYADYFETIRKLKELPIVQTCEIFVPLKLSLPISMINGEELNSLLEGVVNEFNRFELHSYMDSVNGKCANSVLEHSSDGFLFKFHCYDKLSDDEILSLRKDFLGQLTDGWGESVSGRGVLIGENKVFVDFDIDKASDISVVNVNARRNKP